MEGASGDEAHAHGAHASEAPRAPSPPQPDRATPPADGPVTLLDLDAASVQSRGLTARKGSKGDASQGTSFKRNTTRSGATLDPETSSASTSGFKQHPVAGQAPSSSSDEALDTAPAQIVAGSKHDPPNRTELLGWVMYGASVAPYYYLSTSFVPILLRRLATGAVDADGFVYFGSIPLRPAAWATTTQTGIACIQLFTFFFIAPLADFSGCRRGIWSGFALTGAAMSICMICLTRSELWLAGGLMHIVSGIGWGLGNVMQSAYLAVLSNAHPGVVAEADLTVRRSKVAFTSTSLSVHASMAGLGATTMMLLFALGILATTDDQTAGYRIISCMIGCWWFCMSMIPFSLVKTRPGPPMPNAAGVMKYQARRLKRLVFLIRRLPDFGRALIVSFFANAGSSSITQIVSLFGDGVLKMTNLELGLVTLEFIICLLLGAACALLGIRVLHLPIKWVMVTMISIFSLVSCYFLVGLSDTLTWGVKTPSELFGAVAVAGVAGGAVVSMGRGILASMLPQSLEAEFFGYIGVVYNLGNLIIPSINTAIINATNNIRLCFCCAAVCFALSAVAMCFVRIEAGVADASEVAAEILEHGTLEGAMANARRLGASSARGASGQGGKGKGKDEEEAAGEAAPPEPVVVASQPLVGRDEVSAMA